MNNFNFGYLMGYLRKSAADITVGVPPKIGAQSAANITVGVPPKMEAPGAPGDDEDDNVPAIPTPSATDGDRDTGPGGTGMINSGTL